MITAQGFFKAVEDYAISRMMFEALVRQGNTVAEDLATYEPNTTAKQQVQLYYERLLSAASSAQMVMERHEVALLRYIQGDSANIIELAMTRLRIAGGLEAAEAIANQLENRYIAQSQIPEEAR